ncbi:MAG: type III-B CRISPR module RAMP protein Cmr6 [Burkholderiales bacterium]|nr:type III-B CRISPR module RAMP protein Cmr6 [Burkholderiales bacterium]
MPIGHINNIEQPRPGRRDYLVWICPEGVGPQDHQQHIKYFCENPEAKGLRKGVKVAYAPPNDRRVTTQVHPFTEPPQAAGAAAPQAAARREPPGNPPCRHGPPPAFREANPENADDRLCIPDSAAQIVQPRLGDPKPLHPGLLLDRLPTRKHVSKQEHQKEHLERVVKARPWTKESYQHLLQHLEGGRPDFCLTARSRIALHLSRAGGLENANCCLHPIYGFAYLPGSGLKGLAYAYACHLYATTDWAANGGEEQQAQFVCEVEDIFGWAPNQARQAAEANRYDPRSARAGQRDHEQQRGAVVFHDAFGEQRDGSPPELEIDVLTCHYPAYYQGSGSPGDWQSPRPVTFLTIAAGTKFRFRVRPADCAIPSSLVEAAKRLLLGGLYWLGAGAKTAAGYGWFDDHWEEDPETRKQREAQAIEERRRAAAQRLVEAWQSLNQQQALWVPKQENSATGYRLIYQDNGSWTWEDGWNFRRNPQPRSKDLVYRADINRDAPKRLQNPQLLEGLEPPPGRPA